MNQNIAKVLLIEDNPGDAKLVEVLLEANNDSNKHFELIRVGLLSEAFPVLEQGGISAILLDLGLPDGNGLESLTRIYTAALTIPIVVLSAEEDELLAIQSVQLGAQDFLVKSGISELVLRRSLYYAIERKNLLEQLQYLAHYDVMTGLANRKLFYDRLKQDIVSARRSKKSLALIFLDLNDFKLVNDSLGHHSGDDLLKETAKRLLNCIRTTDCAARMGGDEFTIILNNLNNAEDAALIADKILQALAEPFILSTQQTTMYASLGISIYPNDCDDIETLIGAADTAMYQAKESGRGKKGNFCFFSTAMGEKVKRDTDKIQQLSAAFNRDEFELFYQPAVDIRSGMIVGMEALLRWRHPEQGLLTPASFMADLENSGLIVSVGNWVLHQACAQSKSWQQQGLAALMISVNISARQFRQSGFVDSVIKALQTNCVSPSLLELEFHEATLWEDDVYSVQVLNRLAQMGIKLSLDNYGNDMISFKSLTKFPIHAIKIDQSLIQQDSVHSSETIIAKAAIEIARIFHIKGLATGVENEKQLAMVRHIACDDAQGYLYSRPLPVDEASELIARYAALHPQSDK
ncbi:GGDEF domain-containing response regulator [Methylobacter sp.]|uniref:two-component system response regulator n=1 Tax=Methylobacter sp. TaxID=2051955 RepID=UPI001204B8B5|nr:GGDEF domain-containing response regulator [Methylobacter sp.]TAK63168.1 MAG: GGDEF domain-containing response regulator [Methylobacter sp.]